MQIYIDRQVGKADVLIESNQSNPTVAFMILLLIVPEEPIKSHEIARIQRGDRSVYYLRLLIVGNITDFICKKIPNNYSDIFGSPVNRTIEFISSLQSVTRRNILDRCFYLLIL